MCNFVHPPRATLRGLCTNRWTLVIVQSRTGNCILYFLPSRVDVFYTLRWDADTHMPIFKGFHKTIISYDDTNQAWTLTSEDDLAVIGRSPGPIGIAMGTEIMEWTFEPQVCQSDPNSKLKLLLTVCSPQQFTCHNDGEQKIST